VVEFRLRGQVAKKLRATTNGVWQIMRKVTG